MTDVPKDLRALDPIDRELLTLLEADGRMPNNALAERVGIAPSTCLTRIRRLRDIGVDLPQGANAFPARCLLTQINGKCARAGRVRLVKQREWRDVPIERTG